MVKLTANAMTVLERRYLARDDQGKVVETPAAMVSRVARAVATAEANYGADSARIDEVASQFSTLIEALDFLPNSPTLMNAGRPLGQLAACFVVPVLDSTVDIFAAVGWAATIQKTGGGTGFSFSQLRPAGDLVASTGGRASGPVSFLNVFDVATDSIKQGGTRRGANMGILRVDHPDVLEFITAKVHRGKFENFNLSVGLTDRFMEALETGDNFEVKNPRTGDVVGELDARRVFDLMSASAWAGGDPGVVFLDRMNASNPTPACGAFEATNPCGEQPLLPFESCTLGSINLARFVRRGPSGDPQFDRTRFETVTAVAVRFLDNVIDVNRYPLEQIAAATRRTRKIGLGVMGFADLLIELGVPYDSELAIAMAGEIAELLETTSLQASSELAAERGAFPAYAGSRWEKGELGGGFRKPLRNATTTTVAPTGTISIIAGCSSGIEPLYAVAYARHVLDGDTLSEFHPAFERVAKEAGVWSAELAARAVASGRVRGLTDLPEELRSLFGCAHDIDFRTHIRMQAAFQKHVHAAVSKTINVPNEATQQTVADAYKLAFQLGCKGVTVYRDGSRSAQVLSFGKDATEPDRGLQCPECPATLIVANGCSACTSCGYSVCF